MTSLSRQGSRKNPTTGRDRLLNSRRSGQKNKEEAIRDRINRITSEAHLYSDISTAFSSSADGESSGLSMGSSQRSSSQHAPPGSTSASASSQYQNHYHHQHHHHQQQHPHSKTPQLMWEEFEISFAFGLLTSTTGVPTMQGNFDYTDFWGVTAEEGDGYVSTGGMNYPIFEEILVNATNVCKHALLEQRNGNEVIIVHPEKLAYVTSVKLDETFEKPQNRFDIARSYITAAVPIVIKGTGFSESSRIIAKIVVRQALIAALKEKRLYSEEYSQ